VVSGCLLSLSEVVVPTLLSFSGVGLVVDEGSSGLISLLLGSLGSLFVV
jgi:hypothetical protein